jgi:hypothetical protein
VADSNPSPLLWYVVWSIAPCARQGKSAGGRLRHLIADVLVASPANGRRVASQEPPHQSTDRSDTGVLMRRLLRCRPRVPRGATETLR